MESNSKLLKRPFPWHPGISICCCLDLARHGRLADSDDSALHLMTKLVEHLGADTLVHGHFGDNQTDMTIRLSGIQNFRVGEALPMHLEPGKIHLFDPATEKRLG